MTGPRRTVFALVASVLVVGAVVAGMIALGSPREQRARRLDQRRLEDLRALAQGVQIVWLANQRLPQTLDELPEGFARSQRDPESGQPYEYSVRSEKRYQLCATFERDNREEAERPSPGLDQIHVSIWTHGAGRNCFELEPSAADSR